MNFREEKKLMKKMCFPANSMIVITGLGLFGIGLLFYSVYSIGSSFLLKDLLYEYGLLVIMGLLFIGISILIWIIYLINVCMKPYVDTVYLVDTVSGKNFLTRNGKKLIPGLVIEVEPDKYYEVYRTLNCVISIIREHNEEVKPFDPFIKNSYWLTLYLPNGEEYREILLLPLIYVFILPGLLCAILANETMPRVVGLLITCFPIYLIVYDFIQKYIKKR